MAAAVSDLVVSGLQQCGTASFAWTVSQIVRNLKRVANSASGRSYTCRTSAGNLLSPAELVITASRAVRAKHKHFVCIFRPRRGLLC